MENTENTKVTEEIITLNNDDATMTVSGIVISERGGIAPNASAAAQKLIQSSETSDMLFSMNYSETINTYVKLAEMNPETMPLVIEKTDIAQERVFRFARFKTLIKGFTLSFISIVTGVVVYCIYTNNSNHEQIEALRYESDTDEPNEDEILAS